MTYKRRTTFFGIPVPAAGDCIESAEELRKANIIENQLIAGTKGILTAIFEDGEYSMNQNEDGTYTVRCSSTGQKTALKAIINGGLAQSNSTLKWENLTTGSQYWLSAEYSNEMYVDETAFTLAIASSPTIWGNKEILLAHVDLRGGAAVLNTNPDGKVYSQDLEGHVGKVDNPHGEEVSQNTLTINNKLILSNGVKIETDDKLILQDKNGSYTLSDDLSPVLHPKAGTIVGGINELFKRPSTTGVDVVTAGVDGVVVQVEEAIQIQAVAAHETAVDGGIPPQRAGSIVIGYYGFDTSVANQNEFIVYNDGDSGVNLKAMVSFI